MTGLGAAGLLATAVLGAAPVSAGSLPTTGTLYFTCYANQGTTSNQDGAGNGCHPSTPSGTWDVQSATYTYQGGNLTVGPTTGIANTTGADGVQFLNGTDLLVSGQQSGTVTQLDPSSPGVFTSGKTFTVSAGVSEVDHISVAPQQDYVTAGGYSGGGLSLMPVTGGKIQPGIGCTLKGNLPGGVSASNVVMDTVIWTGSTDSSSAYYTASIPSNGDTGGYGVFGSVAISYNGSSCSATLTQLLPQPGATNAGSGFPAAHGMAFDPYSQSLILFGANMIAQIPVATISSTSATPSSEIVFGSQTCTNGLSVSGLTCLRKTAPQNTSTNSTNQFDQGSVDGLGHIFVSDNNGDLISVDYSNTSGGNISQATSVYDHFLTNSLDDVAPIVGSGGQLAVNTTASPGTAVIGQPLSDSATVTNATSGAAVTFQLFGPRDGACASGTTEPVFSSSGTYDSATGTWASGSWTPSPSVSNPEATGTYHWVATYKNTTNGTSASSPCTGQGSEPVVVSPPTVTTTVVNASAPIGGTLADKATLANVPTALTPTLTFTLYSGSCQQSGGTPVFQSTPQSVSSDGTYPSGSSKQVTKPGPYHWTATLDYGSGSVTSSCEPVAVSGTPLLTTTPMPSSAPVNTPIADQATVTGLTEVSGSVPTNDKVSFQIVSSCPVSPSAPLLNVSLGSSTLTLTSNGSTYTGTATSAAYTPTTPGTYYWNVSFAGDTYNAPITNQCGEPVTVYPPNSPPPTPNAPAVTTVPSAGGPVGTALSDTAHITGIVSPASTDNVSFALYSNSSCTALADNLGNASLIGPATTNGVATWTAGSPGTGYAPSVAGTYYWGVTFNSVNDPANLSSSLICGEPVTITTSGGTLGAHTTPTPAPTPAGAVKAASTPTPNTGADLFLPGLLAALALLVGGLLLLVGVRLGNDPSL